ncbi:hypothetical protein ACSYAD_30835 [Acaryochloris marina NIES-2412]|uniref:hypothetical protein n=1 Tax=Acaryochloris marina TaxID=155978 RepID=UPI0040590D3D
MRKRITAALLTTGLSLLMMGVAWAEPEERQQAEAESAPVVTHLVLRNHTITMTVAPEGHRYTVGNAASGEILHVALTEVEMEAQYPRLMRLLQPAVADEDATLMMLAPVVK